MKRIYRTKKELMGAFANCIVRQSVGVPKNLTEILNYINDCLCNWTPQELDVLNFKDSEILKTLVHQIIFENKLVTDLNKSQAEKDGEKVSDIKFASRYSKDDPYTDFVDLDALERNIVNQILIDE